MTAVRAGVLRSLRRVNVQHQTIDTVVNTRITAGLGAIFFFFFCMETFFFFSRWVAQELAVGVVSAGLLRCCFR